MLCHSDSAQWEKFVRANRHPDNWVVDTENFSEIEAMRLPMLVAAFNFTQPFMARVMQEQTSGRIKFTDDGTIETPTAREVGKTLDPTNATDFNDWIYKCLTTTAREYHALQRISLNFIMMDTNHAP